MQHAVPCHVSCASLVMQSLKKWEQLVEVLDSDDVLLGQSWRRRNCRRRRDWAEVVLSVPCQVTRIVSSGFALHEPTIVDGESCAKSVPRCKIILNLLQSACRTVLAASPFPFSGQRQEPPARAVYSDSSRSFNSNLARERACIVESRLRRIGGESVKYKSIKYSLPSR